MTIEVELREIQCPKCNYTGNQATIGDYTDTDNNEIDSTQYTSVECSECEETFHLELEQMYQSKNTKIMHNLLIDLEFTGLDNTFINDNEIVQLKLLNTATATPVVYNCSSVKPIGAHSRLFLKTDRFRCNQTFDKELFMYAIKQLTGEDTLDNIAFFGFGNHQDMYMLRKYGININIYDLRDHYQRTEFERQIANEGSNLESVYLIVTGQYPPHADHSGIEELLTIETLYHRTSTYKANGYFTVMPHGHCAGMPVEQYVKEYRRAADGYRYNNRDLLAETLTNAIESIEGTIEEWDD